MAAASLQRFVAAITKRWRRVLDYTKVEEDLKLLADQERQTAEAIATTTLMANWAKEICELWAVRNIDGCYVLLQEYRVYTCRCGKSGERLYAEVLTKLGADGNREHDAGENASDTCQAAAVLVLSVVQGVGDQPFIEMLDSVIERWRQDLDNR
jgi:CDGSH-type Zn-finger protein